MTKKDTDGGDEVHSQGHPSFATALVAGGFAGTSVDVALFPIDTVKTSLQAPVGFWKAGGLRGIYNGIGAAAAGSAPGAALFFSTYETMKPIVLRFQEERLGLHDRPALSHMVAASAGEAAACLVRVPTEVVKARMQTSKRPLTLTSTIQTIWQERHGGSVVAEFMGGLYRGYGVTLFREIPFAIIQFPLYERFKVVWGERQGHAVQPIQAAACGSLSGGIAAAATTPLDVLKTRIMLGSDRHGVPYKSVADVFRRTMAEEGWTAFASGIQPRVLWISIGGFVFFGAYEEFKNIVTPILG